MTRYVALLRGVSPMNAKMADLRACFEDQLGFTNVKTVLSSGNVIFDSSARSDKALAKTIESALETHLPRGFPVIVRKAAYLQQLLKADPFAAFEIDATAKRVVTFLGEAHKTDNLSLPMERDGVRILALQGDEVLTAYVPNDSGPVFMVLLEKTFGKNVTTRTWDTVRKCAVA